MRSYLLVVNKISTRQNSFSFVDSINYAQRLIKDAGLYGVHYLLYDHSLNRVVQQGAIKHIDFYEKEQRYQAFFEDSEEISHPVTIEIKDNYHILPLNKGDLRAMGIAQAMNLS